MVVSAVIGPDGLLPAPLGIHEIVRTGAVRSVFQPIVDLDTRAVVAYEALARGPEGPWRARTRCSQRLARPVFSRSWTPRAGWLPSVGRPPSAS